MARRGVRGNANANSAAKTGAVNMSDKAESVSSMGRERNFAAKTGAAGMSNKAESVSSMGRE